MAEISLIASGGAGLNIVTSGAPPSDAGVLAIGTDQGRLLRVRKENGLATHLTTHDEVRGWEHVDPAVASHFVPVLPAQVKEAFTRKLVVHVCGLGGVTGTGVAAALTRVRTGLSRPTVHLAVTPFAVEKQRAARALEALEGLESGSAVVVFSNAIILRASGDRPFHESMRIANALVMEVARALCGMDLEGLDRLARAKGRLLPVVGREADVPTELVDFTGLSPTSINLAVPAAVAWLAELRSKLEQSGLALEISHSTGLAPSHWLALVRSSK